MFEIISLVSTILLLLVSFLLAIKGSVVELFLRWMYLSFLLDFAYAYHTVLIPVFIVGIAFKFIQDWRILGAIAVILWYFLTFVL